MPHIETTDLSFIADRVQPQTWTLFQVLRTRMRQMKGVTMKVQYEKHTREPIPAFFYGSRQLFHVHARGEEISATLHADQKARTKIVEDQSIDWRTRDQVKKTHMDSVYPSIVEGPSSVHGAREGKIRHDQPRGLGQTGRAAPCSILVVPSDPALELMPAQ